MNRREFTKKAEIRMNEFHRYAEELQRRLALQGSPLAVKMLEKSAV